MNVYDFEFKNGTLFKINSHTIHSYVEKVDFGYKIIPKVPCDQKIEAFRINCDKAKVFCDTAIVGENYVVGFLKQNTLISTEKIQNNFIAYVEPGQGNDLDPIVILHGYENNFLIKEYVRLVSQENNITKSVKPLKVFFAASNKLEKVVGDAKKYNYHVIMAKDIDDKGNFVNICHKEGFLAGIEATFNLNKLEQMRSLGFDFFIVSFEKNSYKDIAAARAILKNSILVAKNIPPLAAAGLADGIVLNGLNVNNLILYSLFNNSLVRFYIEITAQNKDLLKISSLLNYGLVCSEIFETYYPQSVEIKKIFDGFEAICLSEEPKKLTMENGNIRVKNVANSGLFKSTVVRDDGRFFHFYRTGDKGV